MQYEVNYEGVTRKNGKIHDVYLVVLDDVKIPIELKAGIGRTVVQGDIEEAITVRAKSDWFEDFRRMEKSDDEKEYQKMVSKYVELFNRYIA